MSKIYGFGNALIDIEIQINDDQLASIGIPKGSMQHINKDKKDLLLDEYKDSIRSKNPGGSIANSLFAAENFGASTCFSCSIGDDEDGHLFLDSYSDKQKVFYNFSEEPTGVCLVFITPDGERTMASNLSANYQLNPQCINSELLESCNYLLFDNFSLATDSGNKTAHYCLDKIKNDNLYKIQCNLANDNDIEKLRTIFEDNNINTLQYYKLKR